VGTGTDTGRDGEPLKVTIALVINPFGLVSGMNTAAVVVLFGYNPAPIWRRKNNYWTEMKEMDDFLRPTG